MANRRAYKRQHHLNRLDRLEKRTESIYRIIGLIVLMVLILLFIGFFKRQQDSGRAAAPAADTVPVDHPADNWRAPRY